MMNPRTNELVKEGDLRVWWIKNVPGKAEHVYVADLKEAKTVTDAEILKQLQDPKVFSNVFGLEVYESDGEGGFDWCEWYSEEDENFDEYSERLEEEGDNQ